MAKKFKIKLKVGLPGKLWRHRRTVNSMGLFKHNQIVEQVDSPSLQGKLAQVGYLLEVTEA